MNKLEILQKTIEQKKPIQFEYIKEGKIRGKRIGNPHAIFILTSKKNKQSIKVHIVQTSGVSDSKNERPFPDWRMFDIESLTDIQILNNKPCFQIDKKYNPEWDGYKNVIAKI